MSTALNSSWPLICLTAYAVVVAGLLLGNRRWVRAQRNRVVRIDALPPVPPSRHSDKDWASVWPQSVDDVDLLDAEFVSIISATWCWPDNAEDAEAEQ